MIEMMGFGHLRNSYARNLSGGQKLMLGIGIAFIANPFFVILDKPTSGVDPESRKSVYDFISGSRKNKTILITTHHMEETKILGDEIRIISSGKLIEKGTVFDLKRKFGSPSRLALEMVCRKYKTQNDSKTYPDKIIDFVYDKCPHVINHSIKNQEAIFNIKTS
ncbi:hypothetical protein HZS_4617 [Henneguya salminicola]|nr:hypothetical protein HZS_4617 [Henneguya salminicola]